MKFVKYFNCESLLHSILAKDRSFVGTQLHTKTLFNQLKIKACSGLSIGISAIILLSHIAIDNPEQAHDLLVTEPVLCSGVPVRASTLHAIKACRLWAV